MGVLDVKDVGNGMWLLEWESGASHDMIADSTFALLTSIDKSPASAKRAFSFTLTIFLSLIRGPCQ